MDDETRTFVRQRAGNCCEYCRIHQRYYPDFTFHVEHVIARQHRGPDDPDNLALACHLCNNKKGPNLAGIAPDTGALTRLFHPRTDVWEEHFRLDENGQIVGLTAIGRTTAYVLDMNSEIRIHIRQEILRLASKDDA
jgi:HNH endonuclease